MKNIYEIKADPYPYKIFVTRSEDAMISFCRIRHKDTSLSRAASRTGHCREYTRPNGSVEYIVFARSVWALPHELLHVIIYMSEQLRMRIDDRTSEAFCYLNDSLFQQAAKKLKFKLS